MEDALERWRRSPHFGSAGRGSWWNWCRGSNGICYFGSKGQSQWGVNFFDFANRQNVLLATADRPSVGFAARHNRTNTDQRFRMAYRSLVVLGDSSILARHCRYKCETRKNETAMVTASSSSAIY